MNLVHKQESVFFSRVKEIIPSKFKQKFLRQFLKWYNRKLYLHVPEEYQTEIYGISQYTSDEYDAIAPNYLRTLYLHGVHDIGDGPLPRSPATGGLDCPGAYGYNLIKGLV